MLNPSSEDACSILSVGASECDVAVSYGMDEQTINRSQSKECLEESSVSHQAHLENSTGGRKQQFPDYVSGCGSAQVSGATERWSSAASGTH